ncbi:hypothetical protein L195_g063677, partial [Trifolium pratense]
MIWGASPSRFLEKMGLLRPGEPLRLLSPTSKKPKTQGAQDVPQSVGDATKGKG